MKTRRLFACVSVIMILSMLLAACQPQKIIETVIVTEVVKEIVQGTPVERIIEKIVTPTPLPPTGVPPTAEPKMVDTVVFGLQQEPDTMHPSLSTMTAAWMVFTPIFPQCMLQNEKTEWVPLGCERVPSIENGDSVIVGEGEDRHLEVTYKIRKDWRWTDGTPVTSKDVPYWWKLNMDPDFESQGRLVIEKIYDILVVDDNTVVVQYLSAKQIHEAVAGTLTGQVNFAAFKDDYASNFSADWPSYAVDPSYFFNIGWLPEHVLAGIPAADQDASEFSRNPVGDGPYQLKEWNPGQEIVLEASDQPFPLGEPKVKTIIFRFFGDGSAVKAALQNGEIDAALGTPSGLTEKDGQDLDAIEATGRYKVDWIAQYNNERIDLNVEHFPLDDVRIRQALYYALDRQAVNDVQYFGKKALLSVPLPPGLSWAYPPEDKITTYNYDPDKAKALIAEAGWDCSAFPCTKEVDGVVKNLEFTFLTTDRQDRIAVAQMLQSMWRAGRRRRQPAVPVWPWPVPELLCRWAVVLPHLRPGNVWLIVR